MDTPVIFLVDDDDLTRGMLAARFREQGFEVEEFAGGEVFLAAVANGGAPQIVLLDIEMAGMDGLEACRRYHEHDGQRAPVIFISTHDDLETRLRAYDVGGSDYLIKPVDVEEVLLKVQRAIASADASRSLQTQANYAQAAAFTMMSSMSEMGVVVQFLRDSFACGDLRALADAIANAFAQYQLACVVKLGNGFEQLTASGHGECTPLELSILNHASSLDRIFQFRDRMVINYPNITLVCSNMPIGDPDREGRLRDHLAILAEGAGARVLAMEKERAVARQAEGIVRAAAALGATLEQIDSDDMRYRLKLLDLMNDYVNGLERSFVHLGLSSQQEDALSEAARALAHTCSDLSAEGKEIGNRLRAVADDLQRLIRGDAPGG